MYLSRECVSAFGMFNHSQNGIVHCSLSAISMSLCSPPKRNPFPEIIGFHRSNEVFALQEKNGCGVQVFVWTCLLCQLSASRGPQLHSGAETSCACQSRSCESRDDLVLQRIQQPIHKPSHRPMPNIVPLENQRHGHSIHIVNFNF